MNFKNINEHYSKKIIERFQSIQGRHHFNQQIYNKFKEQVKKQDGVLYATNNEEITILNVLI